MTRSPHGHHDNVPGARELRSRETPAETVLWDALRNRGLVGLKFRRQHPIGPLVADFCCQDLRLVVEVDGGIHKTQREHDTEREALLGAAGYRVVRVRNEEVMDALPAVLDRIRTVAAECLPVPPAERGRTRGW